MATVNKRELARECLDRAKKLVANGDEASARYACLELRFAIEYLVYDQLGAYLQEVGDDALRKWTPKQVITEMLDVDPHADQSSILSFGIEEEYGVPAKEMKVLGEDRRFTLKWANATHNALGNFLHAPTLHQIDNGQNPTADKMLKKANEAIETIQHTLNAHVFNVNFGNFYEFDCKCGARIKRREGSFTKEKGVVCKSCNAVYDITYHDKEKAQFGFSLRRVPYVCDECQQHGTIEFHKIVRGSIVECSCGAKRIIDLALLPIEGHGEQGGSIEKTD